MILSAASIIIVGGIKTCWRGGGYGSLNLMVDNNSGLYEGSTISTVAIAIIPLILWFTKLRHDLPARLAGEAASAAALVFACLLIPIGTATRTGLLCIGLLAHADAARRQAPLPLSSACSALLGAGRVPFLPPTFTERMETIKG